MTSDERRGSPEEVRLTNLGQPLFDGAEAKKGDLVDYLKAMAEQLLGELCDRPLSVIRTLPGQRPFMQKNVPKYAPPWLRTVKVWAETSKREVAYALCNDLPTLLCSATSVPPNTTQRWCGASRTDHSQTHLVLDIDPPAVRSPDPRQHSLCPTRMSRSRENRAA